MLGGVNIALALFNVVPAAPLDGGRLLRAVMWWRTGDRRRATVVASRGSRAGRVFGWALVAYGLLSLFVGRSLGGLWLALIGWFLVGAATAESQQATTQATLAGVTVNLPESDRSQRSRHWTSPCRHHRGAVRSAHPADSLPRTMQRSGTALTVPPAPEVAMSGVPTSDGGSQPLEWSISNHTLILSAGSKQVLAVLTGREPLLLPPGTVLQFDDPPGELVVTSVRVIPGEGGGTVCAEAEPMPKPVHYRTSAASDGPAERPGYLRPVLDQPPRWNRVRPGNG